MRDGDRINVGLFVNSIQNDYSTLMCQGAAIAAEELDVNLIIVPGRELNATWDNIAINRFEHQSSVLYSYINSSNVDAESVSDQLTGIYNRRGFITESEKILKRRSGMSCRGVVVFADLDCLKTINDTFGHREGDFAICKASEILVNSLRTTDVLGRVGGDEFVAFIMDIDEAQLQDLCRRIKDAAAAFNAASDKPYNIGISMGVYSFDTSDGETIDQLMSAADRDLYNSKKTRSRNILKEN